MKYLLTGASGFLGKAIRFGLKGEIITLGRTSENDISADLSTTIPQLNFSPDIVIHAAGKAHTVPKTKQEKYSFFQVNVTGTENLLRGLEKLPFLPRSFIFVSSVAVYGLQTGTRITEDFPLNAKDAYGLSKIKAEQIIHSWCLKNKVVYAVIRLPLLAGPNPPGNLASMIRAIRTGLYFNIDSGRARKSMVLASDIVKIIPLLSEKGGIYNLTDGHDPSFWELSNLISTQLGKTQPPKSIPIWLATLMSYSGDLMGRYAPINSAKLHKIVSHLTFDDSKARNILNWDPTRVLEGFKID